MSANDLHSASYTGSSKQRRDLLKNETDQLGKELPFDYGKVSQLRILKAACNYFKKEKHFASLRSLHDKSSHINGLIGGEEILRNESLSGFIVCFTKSGELIHVSDTSYEHLGLRSIDILFTYDNIHDMVHEHDRHLFEELNSNFDEYKSGKKFSFYALWFVSKIRRNERSLTEYKLIRMSGHFDARTALFVATCTQILSVSNREILSNISASCFTSVHDKKLNFQEVSFDVENLLGYSLDDDGFGAKSLYHLIAPESLEVIKNRHLQIVNEKNTKGYLDAVKILHKSGCYVDCLINLYCDLKEQIFCKYQVIDKQSMKEYNEYVYRFKRDWSLYKFFANPSSSSQRNTNCDIFSESHSNVPLGTKMQENTDHANFIAVESELSYQQMMTAAPVASPAMTKATPGSVPSLKRQLDCDFSESDESFSDSFYNKKIKSESFSPNESFSDSFYNKNIKSESFSPNESVIDLDSYRTESVDMDKQECSPRFDDSFGSDLSSIEFGDEISYNRKQEDLSCFDLNEISEIINIKECIEKEIFKLQSLEDQSMDKAFKKQISFNNNVYTFNQNHHQYQQQQQQFPNQQVDQWSVCEDQSNYNFYNDDQIYQSLIEDNNLFESLQTLY